MEKVDREFKRLVAKEWFIFLGFAALFILYLWAGRALVSSPCEKYIPLLKYTAVFGYPVCLAVRFVLMQLQGPSSSGIPNDGVRAGTIGFVSIFFFFAYLVPVRYSFIAHYAQYVLYGDWTTQWFMKNWYTHSIAPVHDFYREVIWWVLSSVRGLFIR